MEKYVFFLLELLFRFEVSYILLSPSNSFLSKECITVAYYNKSQFMSFFTCVC